ncbi:hypothetical protein [Ornithinimicrobium pekingense]|uniref:DUF3558 domain-containing protein n=1 Tax=Ornithinimicrobium pekingense TaxID=384677 RepID=A0ABQ2F6M6_9MICO|nr:hypothetical protein [Ornithinimicrobium pekingense]GGK58238.1 hypothetical protein GCM10011509_03330 [Ornithinimicrobium pekingense]
MRTRTLTLPAVLAGLALLAGACTSEDADPRPTAEDTANATDDGLEGQAGNQGWMCQYVSPTAVELAAGGEAQTPRELISVDDEDSWVCDVLVGGAGEQEPVIRLSIELGEEARTAARARAEGAEGVEPGPDHLGVSFVSPGLVTGLTLCTAPDATSATEKIPYSLVAESLGETDAEATEHLERALTETAKNLDRTLGCSPRRAVEEEQDAAQTTAP